MDEKAEQWKRETLQNIKWALYDRFLQERLRRAHTAQEVFQLLVSEPRHELIAVS